MSIPVFAFFNNKGGVGKTAILFHLAHMFAHLGKRVLSVDLDPQANLTASFLSEEVLEEIWDVPSESRATIFGAVRPLIDVGDIRIPSVQTPRKRLALLPGDLALAGFEDTLSEVWPKMLGDQNLERPFKITTAFWRVMQAAGGNHRADLIVCDLGPSLGALNRSALVAADFVVIPMGPDLFSLYGLRNLGPMLKRWRKQWTSRRRNFQEIDADSRSDLPIGQMQSLGYIVNRHSVLRKEPVKAFRNWIARIPTAYSEFVLEKPIDEHFEAYDDPNCLAQLKDYRSLAAMAQEHHKPMFSLTVADGAIGAHQFAVRQCRADFERLALEILRRAEIPTDDLLGLSAIS